MAKNIVILSDGTGNAASSRTPTNVWRLYQALDLSNPEKQLAFYDDGVGTERLKPIRLLGGAFGFGLKRNVLEMYRFLSHHYCDGDRVFVFGFSRGAYTVRVLVGFIHVCGLIKRCGNPVGFNRKAREAYSSFRREFLRNNGRLVRWWPQQRGKKEKPSPPFDETKIEFVGVWDTVDAYGLPMDELAMAWDFFIYPYRFEDRMLSPIVRQAAHAMALDDERQTFHPVLWHEDEEGDSDRERIRQVWFAGAHANVGGGYPDDTLAYVPLDWMLSEVEDDKGNSPLIFLAGARDEIAGKADSLGKLYDSRSGLQSFYRFKPRDVHKACNDRANGVNVPVRIHESVFTRMGEKARTYAPFGIPGAYEVVSTGGSGVRTSYEDFTKVDERMAVTEVVWDLVYWRRILYGAMMFAWLVLALSPLFLSWQEAAACEGAGPLCALDGILKFLSPLLPDWSAPWQMALGQNPGVFALLIAVFLTQAVGSRLLRSRVAQWAGAAWRLSLNSASSDEGKVEPGRPGPVLTLARRLRGLWTGYCAAVRNSAIAVAALVAMVLAVVLLANKVSFMSGAAVGLVCEPSDTARQPSVEGDPLSVKVDISNPCFATGIKLVAGQTYSIKVKAYPDRQDDEGSDMDAYPWRDGAIPAGPDGLNRGNDGMEAMDEDRAPVKLWAPFRRVWSEDWMVLMGQIGSYSIQPFRVGSGHREFEAPETGELFLYVNDAVFGIPFIATAPYSWKCGRNAGSAEVTIRLRR